MFYLASMPSRISDSLCMLHRNCDATNVQCIGVFYHGSSLWGKAGANARSWTWVRKFPGDTDSNRTRLEVEARSK